LILFIAQVSFLGTAWWRFTRLNHINCRIRYLLVGNYVEKLQACRPWTCSSLAAIASFLLVQES